MKKIFTMIVVVMLITVPGMLAQQAEKPGGGTGPITLDELAKRQEINDAARALLDRFVGKYRGTVVREGRTLTVELTVNPKFVQGNYHPGYYKMKDTDGNIVFEAATMWTYNIGGMAYLFFYFGGDNLIRTYVGNYSGDAVVVRTPLPQGIEFLRYSMADDDTLVQEKWKPIPNASGVPAHEADEIIRMERIQSPAR
ncbi:MAG TPA: hypothetical protein PLV45_00755 [bacterium]|nr:hypothetical protein [bacterium]